MIKKLIIFLFFLTLNVLLFSDEVEAKVAIELEDIISKYILLPDSRPLYHENTEKVNTFVQRTYHNRFILKKESSKEDLHEAFMILYTNSKSSFEDGSDLYASTKNRSLCYLVLSFLSDKERCQTFLDDGLKLISDEEIFSYHVIIFKIIDLFYEKESGRSRIYNIRLEYWQKEIQDIINGYDQETIRKYPFYTDIFELLEDMDHQ